MPLQLLEERDDKKMSEEMEMAAFLCIFSQHIAVIGYPNRRAEKISLQRT
jgi:hypothetical protein